MTDAPGDGLPTTLGVIEQALFESVPPLKLGRFEVVKQIGRGGMGVVYRAVDPDLKRTVAIKVHRHRSPVEAKRLLAEAEAMARLRHRNVVHVYEVGRTTAGDVFVVMEHLPNRTLRGWVSEARPTAEKICDVFVRCGRGLSAAHAQGLIHRDFKPDNVLMDDGMEPRIIDFGLAFDDTSGQTRPDRPAGDGLDGATDSIVPGTTRYMAPELWDGGVPSAHSDQFALAVSLYECIAGGPPFLERSYSPPSRPRAMPRRIWSVVRRGLDRTPVDRWGSVQEFSDRLRAALTPHTGRWVGAGVMTAVVGAAAVTAGVGSDAPAVATPAATSTVTPCEVGRDLLVADLNWLWSNEEGVHRDGDGVSLHLAPGPSALVRAELEVPMSFRNRAVVFELSQIPHAGTTHEAWLTLAKDDAESVAILLWHGDRVFPMAANTHGLALPIDRTQDLWFRIQVQDQTTAPDLVTFEFSDDGREWTPIARVESSVGNARVQISLGSHEPVVADDSLRVRRVYCTELQPVAHMSAERNRAREEPKPARTPE